MDEKFWVYRYSGGKFIRMSSTTERKYVPIVYNRTSETVVVLIILCHKVITCHHSVWIFSMQQVLCGSYLQKIDQKTSDRWDNQNTHKHERNRLNPALPVLQMQKHQGNLWAPWNNFTLQSWSVLTSNPRVTLSLVGLRSNMILIHARNILTMQYTTSMYPAMNCHNSHGISQKWG